jgi:hypothetical protein
VHPMPTIATRSLIPCEPMALPYPTLTGRAFQK